MSEKPARDDGLIETLGRVTIATQRRFSSLWLAEGLPGVEPPRRSAGR